MGSDREQEPPGFLSIEASDTAQFLDTLITRAGFGALFRGHSRKSYKLLPTALRVDAEIASLAGILTTGPVDDQQLQIAAEAMLLFRFFEVADRRGLRVPAISGFQKLTRTFDDKAEMAGILNWLPADKTWMPENLWDLAALSQHFGVPTRLLDWSYSPLAAAFFALGKPRMIEIEPLVVWILEPNELEQTQILKPAYSPNERLNAQDGAFTLNIVSLRDQDASVDRSGLENHPVDAAALTRVELPGTHRADLETALFRRGITASVLFPGFEGVTQEIARGRPCASPNPTIWRQLVHHHLRKGELSSEVRAAMERLQEGSYTAGDGQVLAAFVTEAVFELADLSPATKAALLGELMPIAVGDRRVCAPPS